MHFNNYLEQSLTNVEKIKSDLETIRPTLNELAENLEEDVEEGIIVSSGVISQSLHPDQDERLPKHEINYSLGLVAYEGLIELKEDCVWTNSSCKQNHFDLSEYSDEIFEDLMKYLEKKIEEKRNEEGTLVELGEFNAEEYK